jgi:trans-2,3-dihydro-3-hydroxyanthranilate isomerase
MILTTNHRPHRIRGAPFIIAELRNRDALTRAPGAAEIFHAGSCSIRQQHAVYTQVDEGDIDVARMFAPHRGIPEDPATGSANVALIGLLAKLRPEQTLHLSKTIAQGVEMGRPSLLMAEAEKKNGSGSATYIGGHCAPVMSGTIDVA